MVGTPSLAPKPRSETIRDNLTRLPRLTWWRRFLRWLIHRAARVLVWLFIQTEVEGLENFPRNGPALIVSNHLGDADLILGWAINPGQVEIIGKVELYDLPLLGKILDAYGVIWVHRGQPDRRAIRSALRGLKEGRMVAIAPEGRESITGSLEEGTGGAAYLALKADVPIVPVTVTETGNRRIYGNILRLRRTRVTINIGPPFRLEKSADFRTSVQAGTEKIMLTLANQLPPDYRGVYNLSKEDSHGCE